MGKPTSMSASNRTKWCWRSRCWCRCGCTIGGDILITKLLQKWNKPKCPKIWVWGPMDCIRCVCCEKFQHNFVARICALIASVRRVLHQSSCSKETFRNILTQLHCTKLCTIITPVQHVLHRLSCSNKMVRNTPRQEFGIKWNGSGAFIVKKCRHDFVAQTCTNCTSSACFVPKFVQ
jgi:hypothetical protein